jgi:O-antigen ligase
MYLSGRLRTKHVLVVGAAGAMALAAGLVASAVAEFEGRPDNVADRLNQFDIGVGAALESPLTGIGLGEFQLLHDGIIHNSLIWLWVEGGLIGVVLFAALALAPIRLVLRASGSASQAERRLLHGLLGAHICMLVVSMGIEATYQRYWWFYLALITSVVAQVQSRASARAGHAPPDLVPVRHPVGR